MQRIVLVACLAMLAACGFRLQGRQPLPAALVSLQVDAVDDHSDFTAAMRRVLSASGAKLVEQGPADGAVLRIVRDKVSEHVLSVDARNIPTDYELVYEVEVTVRAGGKDLLTAQPFSLSRIYSFDESRLLAKQREKELLRAALARDIAGMVMRRLASL